ncbi:hypothetical protein FQN60_016808 [Etheostoma spectabile]|uniref:Uncharacterized protein n=1 Tax=Etheostoma spectabile TaxID=54343 RepID=A0A5J5CCY3_9PERO|nr:hypothetical protein FQN60_016808 [Etheostoma spectabile]
MSVEPKASQPPRPHREDAGAYVCLTHGKTIVTCNLPLTVTYVSSVTDLQPGGNLILSCVPSLLRHWELQVLLPAPQPQLGEQPRRKQQGGSATVTLPPFVPRSPHRQESVPHNQP